MALQAGGKRGWKAANEKHIEVLEHAQKRARELGKGLAQVL